MNTWRIGILALIVVVVLIALNQMNSKKELESKIDLALAGEHRSEKNKNRDQYRHPMETLSFFGLETNFTVLEITPGGGWYTEVLAPVMRDDGALHAAIYNINDDSRPIIKKLDKIFRGLLASRPHVFDQVEIVTFDGANAQFGKDGSYDMILTFRNVHNWAKAGTAKSMFSGFYKALKPGGVLGVTDHRAKPDTPFERQIASGYMTENFVLQIAAETGFELAGKSEINANSNDTADHPGGVWNLPPSLRNIAEGEKEKFLKIGESDRMTMKFVKPKS